VTVVTLGPGSVQGRIAAPSSKSYTHRAVVVAYLSGRRFSVRAPLSAEDTRATAVAVHRLGVDETRAPGRWTFRPRSGAGSLRPLVIDCGESGTTLRFVTVLAALTGRPTRLQGRGRLGQRPMRPLCAALERLGAVITADSGGFPFSVRGPIHGGTVRLDGSESSQFASALFLALPSRAEDSRVTLTGRIVSAPYLHATLAVLRHFHVEVTRRGREFRIPGGQTMQGSTFRVPGDASSAAYLWAAGAIAGGPVTVRGVSSDWPQADRAVLDLLRAAGADVREGVDSVTVQAGTPRPFSVDLTPSPDLYPLAGVLAATLPGRSRLRGAAHAVHKESDRRAETARLAAAFGARVRDGANRLEIEGRGPLRPVRLSALTDHRVVMSAAVGALAASAPSRIGAAEAVRKSFPEFWRTLRTLGAEVGAP
jgi:3-phosphoshikimate 1-carboxyvinyltransferase